MGTLDIPMSVGYSLDVGQLQKEFIASLHSKYLAEMQSFLQFVQLSDAAS